MKDENKNLLGILLKREIDERQLSLRSFAKILGISHGYLNKLIIGVDTRSNKPISPSICVLLKIADALEIQREEFFLLCGYMKEKE